MGLFICVGYILVGFFPFFFAAAAKNVEISLQLWQSCLSLNMSDTDIEYLFI